MGIAVVRRCEFAFIDTEYPSAAWHPARGELLGRSRKRFQMPDNLKEMQPSTFSVDNLVEKIWMDGGMRLKSRAAPPLPVFLAEIFIQINKKI
ncbi:MAG: hypothetical protein HKL98_03730 [Burkholderiales bacterium]|nr:hypothetical protein [Burkholderiales bacterium]